jgi:hypothetical protein
MVEVVSAVAAHPEPLHDPPRADVGRYGERHYLVEAEVDKARLERRPARLGRDSPAPERAIEAPADLDCGREMLLERRLGEPHEADERLLADYLDCPEPIAEPLEVGRDPIDERVGSITIEWRREMLHDERIGVQHGKRLAIGLAPPAQDKALRPDLAELHGLSLEQGDGLCGKSLGAPGESEPIGRRRPNVDAFGVDAQRTR